MRRTRPKLALVVAAVVGATSLSILPAASAPGTGTPDAGFSDDGRLVWEANEVTHEMLEVFPHGDSFVVHGLVPHDTHRLAGFNNDGSLDYSFGDGGLRWLHLQGGVHEGAANDGEINDVVQLASGRFAIVGTTPGIDGATRVGVAYYTADGMPEGEWPTADASTGDGFSAVVAAAQGEAVIVVVEGPSSGTRLIRFDGTTLDPDFDAEIGIPVDRILTDDASVLVVGDNDVEDGYEILTQRFLADGARDEQYAGGGAGFTARGSVDLLDAVLDNEGGVVVGWAPTSPSSDVERPGGGLRRLDPSGQEDRSFGADPGRENTAERSSVPYEHANDYRARAMTRDAIDGTLYLVGDDGDRTRVWAFDPQGRPRSFGCKGSASIDIDARPERVRDALASSSRVLVATDVEAGTLEVGRPKSAWGFGAYSLQSAATGCGYLVEGSGQLRTFAGKPLDHPVNESTPSWAGWDIARGVAALPGRDGGFVVDGWGGMHPFGLEPRPARPAGTPYWRGWDIVRGITLLPDGTGGYLLDGWGGLHPFGVGGNPPPPRPIGGPYWVGWDIARDLTILPDGSGGYIVDGWGGLHPFAIGDHPRPPAIRGGPYWVGWDMADGIVAVGDGSGGYVVDAWGGRHAFAIGSNVPPGPSSGPYDVGVHKFRGATFVP